MIFHTVSRFSQYMGKNVLQNIASARMPPHMSRSIFCELWEYAQSLSIKAVLIAIFLMDRSRNWYCESINTILSFIIYSYNFLWRGGEGRRIFLINRRIVRRINSFWIDIYIIRCINKDTTLWRGSNISVKREWDKKQEGGSCLNGRDNIGVSVTS